jgi:hypothetical protein
MEKDLVRLDSVIKLLEFERETWVLLMKKLVEERAAANGTTTQPTTEGKPDRQPALSIQA